MSHSNRVIPTPHHPPQKKPCRFFETPYRGGLLGKSGSSRQKIPLSIAGIEKINFSAEVDFMPPGAGPLKFL